MSVKRVIDNKKIGANIRLARVKKMMSQSELAKLLGVTQTHMRTDALLYGTPGTHSDTGIAGVVKNGGIENYTLGDLIKAAKLLDGCE